MNQFWVLLILLMATCSPARAETCQPDPTGKFVVCEREGFDRAVKKCSGAFQGEAACGVKLKASLDAWEDLNGKYQKCVGDQSTPSSTKPVLGYIGGLAGLGAVIIAPTLETGTGVKWGISIGGVLLVASGLWAVLP